METLDNALDYVNDKLVGYLSRELVKARLTDVCPLVRRCILEQFQSFEANELRQACNHKEMKLI